MARSCVPGPERFRLDGVSGALGSCWQGRRGGEGGCVGGGVRRGAVRGAGVRGGGVRGEVCGAELCGAQVRGREVCGLELRGRKGVRAERWLEGRRVDRRLVDGGHGRGGDRGAGTVWVLAFMGVIWMVGVAAMVVGGVRVARHRVEAAADLGALAAARRVSEGEEAACRAARGVAADSGGRVASCLVRGRIIEVSADVVVRLPFGIHGVRVAARARAGPVGLDGVP
ncbi:Rv3654c family TadE-like protein [Actinomadura gamaensis]|uniref:Rv3654c family TadE-like protein n=1 Tax=Actinomadura gamaensis TaxID=1763541 RepID=A0ABV9TXX5_9ACTN